MILLTDRTESTKIPDYDIMIQHPLNPARRAFYRMRDDAEKERREFIEVSCWHDFESMSEVVAVKSRGVEKWD